MTEDEKIILYTLRFIKRKTKYNAYVNILTTLWKDWDDDKQNYFRELLWEQKLINLNTYQWEFQITTAGKDFIKGKDKEIEEDLFEYLVKERDVRDFMIDHFIQPDDLSDETTNDADDGVIFLRNLKKRKLIDFDDGSIGQINRDLIPRGNNQHKRWYNNLTGALIVTPIAHLRDDVPLETEPRITPQTIPQRMKAHIGTIWLVRNLKKLSIKNIIEMIIAGLIVGVLIGWLIWYLRYNAVRPQQPTDTDAHRKIEAKKASTKKD